MSSAEEWLALCALGQIASSLGSALSLRDAAAFHGGPRLSAARAFQIGLASEGASRALAAGGIGGLALVGWLLTGAGLERSEAVARVFGLSVLAYVYLAAARWLSGIALTAGAGVDAPLHLTVRGSVFALAAASPALADQPRGQLGYEG